MSTRLVAVLGFSDGRTTGLHPVCAARLARAEREVRAEDVVLFTGWARGRVARERGGPDGALVELAGTRTRRRPRGSQRRSGTLSPSRAWHAASAWTKSSSSPRAGTCAARLRCCVRRFSAAARRSAPQRAPDPPPLHTGSASSRRGHSCHFSLSSPPGPARVPSMRRLARRRRHRRSRPRRRRLWRK